jgi:hypothetical protein
VDLIHENRKYITTCTVQPTVHRLSNLITRNLLLKEERCQITDFAVVFVCQCRAHGFFEVSRTHLLDISVTRKSSVNSEYRITLQGSTLDRICQRKEICRAVLRLSYTV